MLCLEKVLNILHSINQFFTFLFVFCVFLYNRWMHENKESLLKFFKWMKMRHNFFAPRNNIFFFESYSAIASNHIAHFILWNKMNRFHTHASILLLLLLLLFEIWLFICTLNHSFHQCHETKSASNGVVVNRQKCIQWFDNAMLFTVFRIHVPQMVKK